VTFQVTASRIQHQALAQPSPTSPPDVAVPLTRQICAMKDCNITVCHEARMQGKLLCMVCFRRDASPRNTEADLIPRTLPLHVYGLGHTDGGCRNVPNLRLKDVEGWAFILMHSKGELWKASCSLGPHSSNNVAEFTAVLELVMLSKQQGITLLDIHTDSMLVIQYFEQTCEKVEQRLIALYQQIQSVVAGLMHLNFHHVKAHAKKGTPQYNLNNTEVDSMCTEVIKVNDMERCIQGPSRMASFDLMHREM